MIERSREDWLGHDEKYALVGWSVDLENCVLERRLFSFRPELGGRRRVRYLESDDWRSEGGLVPRRHCSRQTMPLPLLLIKIDTRCDMHPVTVWRAVRTNDLEFVARCSVLATLFIPDDPWLLFEFSEDDRPAGLLTRAQFESEIERKR